MVALERGEVALPLVDAELLVRLEQRGVPDHVGEHHRDEPPLERFAHGATLSRPQAGEDGVWALVYRRRRRGWYLNGYGMWVSPNGKSVYQATDSSNNAGLAIYRRTATK